MSDLYCLRRRTSRYYYRATIEFVNHSDSSQQKLYIEIIDKNTCESWGSKTIELKVLKTNLRDEQPIHSVYSESPLSAVYSIFLRYFERVDDWDYEFSFDQRSNNTIRVSCGCYRTLELQLILESNGINNNKWSKKKIKDRLKSIEDTMYLMKGDPNDEISQLEDTIDEMKGEISKLKDSILELTIALENKSFDVVNKTIE